MSSGYSGSGFVFGRSTITSFGVNSRSGIYIVDFVCLQKRLIVELDGGQHNDETNYDAERDAWLCHQGFTVLRFWNNDVLKNIEGVMELIVKSLQGTPYLNPSPQGGRKKTRTIKRRGQVRS